MHRSLSINSLSPDLRTTFQSHRNNTLRSSPLLSSPALFKVQTNTTHPPKRNKRAVLLAVSIILVFSICSSFTEVEGMRPLEGDEWGSKDGILMLQSLQRGKKPPSDPSDCTHGKGKGKDCPLMGKNFAVHALAGFMYGSHDIIERFGTAAAHNETEERQENDQRS
ncbi:hypothetical protein ACLOJK_032331 [Asimina triloba]